jgi:hypothetical protein
MMGKIIKNIELLSKETKDSDKGIERYEEGVRGILKTDYGVRGTSSVTSLGMTCIE